jgi:asparagine synthase (glutamine-hydrolysing)
MAAVMVHRGPDGKGVWHDADVGLSFRRLAVIDLDERSSQPMHLGELHLVFNGEIYNYVELRNELRAIGHGFVTEGDAEVLLHAWAEWGERALDRLNGMFAFAIWDSRRRELHFAVDRFAEKPLFFHSSRDRLMFGSEVAAMRAADPTVGVPDPDATGRFLALGTMPELPETFFSDVRRLAPSHLARWTPDGRLTVRRYWEPKIVDVPTDGTAAARELRRLLTDSIRLRLRSDVPVGTSLSGGIDSSTVVAIASTIAGDHRRHAFTATFPGFERDEWSYADAVASDARVTAHHAVRPEMEELFEDLPSLVASQEEPFGSTSIYAQWRVMRAAREAGVVVLLDGQGADELFAGYLGCEGWAIRTLGPRAAATSVLRNRRLAGPVVLAYSDGRAPRSIARWHQLRQASPYVPRELALSSADYVASQPGREPGESPLRRELLTQAFRLSLPQLCRFADRDGMAFSVEVRLPFLDPRIAEFALSLPADLVWRRGVTKWVLRHAVRDVVPASVLARRDKIGYETPEHKWFGSAAGRTRIADILLDAGTPQLLTSEVERDLASGTWRDTPAIWRAVNVHLWLRTLVTPELARA